MTIDEAVTKAEELLPLKVLRTYAKSEVAAGMVYGVLAAEIFAEANGLPPVVFVQGE